MPTALTRPQVSVRHADKLEDRKDSCTDRRRQIRESRQIKFPTTVVIKFGRSTLMNRRFPGRVAACDILTPRVPRLATHSSDYKYARPST